MRPPEPSPESRRPAQMRRYRATRRPPSKLTRRELLLGGAGVCAALAAGAVVERGRIVGEAQHLVTRSEHSLRTHTGASVVYYTFHSSVLGKEVDYGIAWPAGVTAGEALPVCFCLPGRGSGPQPILGAPLELAASLDAAVKDIGRPFALAAVDSGQSYWHRRADGEDRMAMLIDEFIPLCERRYHLGGSRARRAAMGWSMGAYGVLLAAETYRETFAAVVATAPAIWPSYAAMMEGPRDAFDSAADFAAHDVIGHAALLAGTPLLIECGTADPFYWYVRDLCAVLPAGAHYRFCSGGHSYQNWRRLGPAALEFIGRHF